MTLNFVNALRLEIPIVIFEAAYLVIYKSELDEVYMKRSMLTQIKESTEVE